LILADGFQFPVLRQAANVVRHANGHLQKHRIFKLICEIGITNSSTIFKSENKCDI